MPSFGSWIKSLPRLSRLAVTRSRTSQHVAVVVRAVTAVAIRHEVFGHVTQHVRLPWTVPRIAIRVLYVVEDYIVNWRPSLGLVVRAGTSPNDLAPKIAALRDK